MKSRLLVLTLIAAAFSQLLFAVPARRGWKDYRTDKGASVTLQMVGDEFGHWLEDSQGTAYRLLDDGTVALSEKTAEQLSERRKASPRYRASRPQRTSGNINLAPRGIVILVNYPNLSMQSSNTQAAFNDMMNKAGYNYRNTHNSVREYFREQSRGAYVPDFDVYGPVTILNNYSYYGANDSNGDDMYPGDIVVEAVKAVDSQYDVDFSVYNNDGDDEIDFVYILYAGKGEADGGAANTIWPHNWSVSSARSYGNCTYSAKQSMVDGLYINNYAMSGELDGYTGYRNSIGTICHEFGHVLGLPDLYDTSYGSNYNAKVTPNNYDIMDGGSYNGTDSNGTASCGTCPPNYSPFERIYLGWDAPINPGTTGTNLTLYPSENAGYRCYQINSGGYLQEGTTEAINYYIENRQQTGWDAYLPGHGMLVWKVNYNETYWSENKPNHSDYGNPHCTLVSASGTQLTSGSNTYPGTASITTWSSLSNRRVTSITETGGLIRAAYMGGGTNTTIDIPCSDPYVVLTAGEIVSDAPYWTINVGGFGQQDNAIYRLKVEMNSSYIEGNFTLDNVRSFTSDYSVNNAQTYNTITPVSLAATVTYSGNNTYQIDILVTDNNGMRYHYTMAATTTLPAYNTPLEKTVCKSELPVTWEGVTFDKADTKTTSLTATNRCDSVLTLTLNVLPSYANITDGATIWSSELPYTWEGEVFNEAGDLTKTLKTVNGCDSVVTFTLTVQPSPDVTDITGVNANFAAHPFTVGDNEKRVVFSQGNLQYQASTQTYRFAYNQYDYMRASNAQIATDYTGWIDLFGWGTGTNPTLHSCTDCGTHFDYGGNMGNDPDDPDNPDYTFDAPSRRHTPQEENDYPTFADWGQNAVVNGGNMAGIWRTMTADEWNYLFYSRENASAKFGFATISGVRGLVILPDDWEQPAAEYIFLAANDAGWQANDSHFSNNVVNSFTYNAYSTSQWAVMEAAGAVFLPAAGNRLGKTCDAAGKEGYYWSATADEETTSFTAFFDNSVFYPATARARAQGHSVRLVKGYSLGSYTVTFMNGNEVLQSTEVEYGATPVYEGETPSKQADTQYTYVFAGWEPEITAVAGDVTYQAVFTSELRKYTVTFMNGDVELQSSEVEYGATPVYEGATPSKSANAQYSYVFAGWDPEITAVTGDATYQATFTAEVRKYTVTFYNYDGTTVLQSTEVEYGATPVYEGETPVKPADNYLTYTFIGWDKDIVTVTGAAEYTAVYSEEERKFTVTWQYIDEFNQQHEDAEQYSYGQKIDEPYDPYPHRSDGYHYYFTHWLLNGDGEPVVFDDNLTVDGDKVFVAAYETVRMYEITFYDNDGTTVLQTVWCDENALPAFTNPTPSRDGMVFAGWDRTVVLAVEATSYTATYAEAEAAGDALQGGFSVSNGRKVRFAKGNLQYDLAEDSWSLARTQYDIIGLPNINLGDENFHGTIDMFAYSTESTNYGVNPSNADADYTGEFRDWGQLIGDGWFTLTKEEWVYLYSRKGGSLWGSAMVVDRKGLILLPDEWQLPEGLEFTPKYRVDDYEIEDLEKNKYTLDEWKRMEAAGAVFLPAAGRRTGGIGNTMNGANEATFINPATGFYSFMDNTDIYGYYWSSTSRNSTLAYYLIFNGDSYYQLPGVWSCEKRRGQSVRLAREALYTVIFTDGNGNMLGGPQTIAYGGAATAPDVEVPDCSTFVWDKDFSRVTSDLTVNAIWTVTPVPAYYVTSEDNTKGTVTVTHSPASCLDLTLSFRADANDGYGFVQWSDGSTDNPRTLTLTQDTVITALFESLQPELPMDIILQETETNAYYDQFADDYEGVKVNTATLNRQFKQGVWSTFCLPFNVGSGLMTALSLRGRVYDFYHAEADLEEGGKVTLYFSQAKSMVAGRCYIVNANAKLAAIESFVFNAVTIDLTADKVSDLMVTDAYDGLDGHNDGTGTLSLIGTLRNGKVLSSEKGRYFGLSNNQIREANTTTGTTLRAYRGIFRSTIPVNAARVRIVVEGEPVTELEIIREETQPSDEAQKFIHKGVLYIERNGKIYNAQGMRIE